MWYKIKELTEKGLKTGQISVELGIHPDTVRAYRKMTPEEVERRINSPYNNHRKKLLGYTSFITELLKRHPYLTAPQIHDKLKENFTSLPVVSDKTVYNFVETLREQLDIPKDKEPARQMVKIPETLYGKEAQVDWGEKNMVTGNGRWKKVYFFVMILSRSRHKFVYFQDIPFTAATTVYGHHLAFEFFGGVPERILYDQDVKLIVSENLGDYILTNEMEAFRKTAGFMPVFCKAADPQSKGKVENVVKYIKQNFIRGRLFTTIENLNGQALGWLERTGNGHRHATTRLIPAEEFEKEKEYLKPYTTKIQEPVTKGRLYTVRRDNTVSYHSCYYQLPNGIYNGDDTKVRLVEISDNEIEIYDTTNGDFIISYTVSAIKGRHIVKPEVMTSDKRDVTKEENLLLKHYEGKPMQDKLLMYMATILEDRPRYYNASIRALWELFPQLPDSIAPVLLDTLIENKTLNAFDAFEVASALLKRHHLPPLKKMMSRYGRRGQRQAPAVNLEPLKSDITSYDILIKELAQN